METQKGKLQPVFYEKFQCTAGACSMTCCQEWKIAVDKATFKKWKKLSLTGTPGDTLNHYVCEKDGGKVVALNRNHKCPFLQENLLCELVCHFGEEVLSHTCATFPRQVHEFADREEYSLVNCCPTVVDLLHEQKLLQWEWIDEKEKKQENQDAQVQLRSLCISLLQNKKYSLPKAFLMCFYLVKDSFQREACSHQPLDELAKAMDGIPVNVKDMLQERNELLLDLSENYQKEGLYQNFLAPILAVAEEYENPDREKDSKYLKAWTRCSQLLVEHEELLRNVFAMELFTSLVLPEGTWEEMLVSLQWIAMEYAVLMQAILLRFLHQGCPKQIPYEDVREAICVIARMTGYDLDDIYQYLENSFQEIVWEWGYFLLVTGCE